jgi:two-component system response regulator LytT
MQPFRILIVEDEALVAMDMERMLINLGYEVLPKVNSYDDAIRLLDTTKPDLILLDINLNDTKTGIDLSQRLQQQYRLPFIYITSHSDKSTMDQALLTKPNGYLLKPFDENDLYTAIEIALSNYSAQPAGHQEASTLVYKDALFIKNDKNFIRVDIDDICWIESDHNYLYIVTQKGKHIIRSNFRDFQQQVPPAKFFQVHKSYMINLSKVDAFSHTDITINGKEIPLSRMYKDDFFACMKRIL